MPCSLTSFYFTLFGWNCRHCPHGDWVLDTHHLNLNWGLMKCSKWIVDLNAVPCLEWKQYTLFWFNLLGPIENKRTQLAGISIELSLPLYGSIARKLLFCHHYYVVSLPSNTQF